MPVSVVIRRTSVIECMAPSSHVVAVGWATLSRIAVLAARKPMGTCVVMTTLVTKRFIGFYIGCDAGRLPSLVRSRKPLASAAKLTSAFSKPTHAVAIATTMLAVAPNMVTAVGGMAPIRATAAKLMVSEPRSGRMRRVTSAHVVLGNATAVRLIPAEPTLLTSRITTTGS